MPVFQKQAVLLKSTSLSTFYACIYICTYRHIISSIINKSSIIFQIICSQNVPGLLLLLNCLFGVFFFSFNIPKVKVTSFLAVSLLSRVLNKSLA